MYSKTILIGRLTADPELRQTQGGISVTSFTVAVGRTYTPKGGERQTDFIDIVAWRNTAEFVCRYFTKGKPILVEGSIQTRTYTDKNGQNRKAWEVVADNCHFVESKGASQSGGQAPMPDDSNAPPYRAGADNLPAPAYTSGSVDDFAEIDDDGDLPF